MLIKVLDMDLRSRIEICLHRAGLTKTHLAQKLNIKTPSLHALLIEKSPMLEQLGKTAEILGVDREWLRFGYDSKKPAWWDEHQVALRMKARATPSDENDPPVGGNVPSLLKRIATLEKLLGEMQTKLEQHCDHYHAVVAVPTTPPPPDTLGVPMEEHAPAQTPA